MPFVKSTFFTRNFYETKQNHYQKNATGNASERFPIGDRTFVHLFIEETSDVAVVTPTSGSFGLILDRCRSDDCLYFRRIVGLFSDDIFFPRSHIMIHTVIQSGCTVKKMGKKAENRKCRWISARLAHVPFRRCICKRRMDFRRKYF